MRDCVEIENIEDLRLQQGIDDIELREEIRGLRIGSLVKLTLLTSAAPLTSETVVVRITSIKGPAYRGKLVQKPAAAALASFPAGSPVVFRSVHIHSVTKG